MKQVNCLFCGMPVTIVNQYRHSSYSFSCKNCGDYQLSERLWEDIDEEYIDIIKKNHYNISGCIRECTERNIPLKMIKTDSLTALYDNVLIPTSIEDKCNKMLLFMRRRSEHLGHVIEEAYFCDYPATCYAYNRDELHEIRKYLLSKDYIQHNDVTDHKGYKLTLEGMDVANNLKEKQITRNAFILISNSDDMKPTEDTIKDAIKETGYNPVINPKVFISYSWEDDDHKKWVKKFANQLISDGINAVLDQYDINLGDRLPHFMEKSISDADYVLIVCTPTYKSKSDSRNGGVGYEGHIISGELLSQGNERKFIPVIRKGTSQTALPACLSGKLGVDFTGEKSFEGNVNYQDLITTLCGIRKKPRLGAKPSSALSKKDADTSSDTEQIHIQGIIIDEITVPKMDGTRGSALYAIPFRLSKRPSDLWCKLFVAAWNMPPKFTSMHRRRIASVRGDKIILDGTTIEEVRDVHRETLKLCVDEANKNEMQILKKEQLYREREENRKNEHYTKVNSIADKIDF